MTRILIADDHALVRAGLKQFLLEERADLQIAEASTAAAYDASDPTSINKVFTAVVSNF